MTIQYFLDNLWRWKCNLPELDSSQKIPTLDELKKSEWSEEFETYMRNRLIMGAIRYGRIGDKNKPQYDRVKSMIKRLNQYTESGNKEYLVDVANLCLLEFTESNHPNQHFKSIDDGEHVTFSDKK